MVNIDKGVPVPPSSGTKYPFGDMEDGDSFLVPVEDKINVLNSARQWIRRNRDDLRIVSRTLEEGVRIWFVKKNDT
jgi:hypothetical protein